MASFTEPDHFAGVLHQMDLIGDSPTGQPLLFIKDINNPGLSAKEVFALEAAKIYRADAVYFRRFEDNRPPIAQIFIYDNSRNRLTTDDYADIQKLLWSACVIPLFIIIEKSQVLIFDSRKPVSFLFDKMIADPLESLKISAQALKEYSAKLFDNGSFWEKRKTENQFLETTSAYRDLVDGLKKIRKAFLHETGLPKKTAHKLLVLSILIKYLEERGEDGETLFARNFFSQFGADDFCDVLRKKGQVVKLFSKLSRHFNGHIFSWNDAEEKELLENSDLSLLARFLDANTSGNQYVLWRKYSFSHLPVELISSVYEEFLSERNDVVYTPHFLVNTLVDECMPLSEPKHSFKLVDVSCGSGIFLVVAYKRLVEWWRYEKYLESGMLPEKIPLRTLKNLLQTGIFGVDIEEDATRLTIFSLALALCDFLSPKQIWTELKFDELSRKNIITGDFFNSRNKLETDFDLVIGNPPFDEYNKDDFDSLIAENGIKLKCKIPQNQVALLFLDQSMHLLRKGGSLCLIMPSGPLLYNDTLEFRKYFFKSYKVSQILDFTNLSSVLFGASVATSAIFVDNSSPDICEHILHVTVRRTKPAKKKMFFEIDHYDFHRVNYDDALTDKFIWKANLYGGSRVHQLIKRLFSLRSISAFIQQKKATAGWDSGQGYIVGEKNRKHEAPYITGRPTVIDRFFDEDGIRKTEIQYEKLFKDKSKESIFHPPHLLIKKSIGNKKIPVVFSNKYLTFKNEVIGIAAPKGNETELKQIESHFSEHADILRFYISTTSARAGVSRSSYTLLLEDIMSLPYPEDKNDIRLSFAEKIIVSDVLNYLLEQNARGENAKVHEDAQERSLLQYAYVFCKSLNSVFQEGLKKFQLSMMLDTPTFNALVFNYSSREISEVKTSSSRKDEVHIETLVRNQTGKNLRINRIIKIYEKDKVFLIKPKPLRYWLRSMALSDADETLNDLIKAGY